jgi:transposase
MDEEVGVGVGPAERAHHAGGDGPTPGTGAGCRRIASRRRCCACCAARTWSCCPASPRPASAGRACGDGSMTSSSMGVTAAELSGWREAFLAAGEASLKTRPADARDAEIGRLKEKVGELTMANELLAAKIERLETARPLAPRRSRR